MASRAVVIGLAVVFRLLAVVASVFALGFRWISVIDPSPGANWELVSSAVVSALAGVLALIFWWAVFRDS